YCISGPGERRGARPVTGRREGCGIVAEYSADRPGSAGMSGFVYQAPGSGGRTRPSSRGRAADPLREGCGPGATAPLDQRGLAAELLCEQRGFVSAGSSAYYHHVSQIHPSSFSLED
ncbi:MAG: hypothetical protein LBE08_02390, partial [Bifidobacteriaceae bacterium]|nr:hypothetical protein [Bifidobacteriaceae bacterium]